MAEAGSPLTHRLVDSLYSEAMLLADETRAYFGGEGIVAREALPPRERVMFACEALKGTTRLMQVVAWLLTRRAIEAGELPAGDPSAPARRLGTAPGLAIDAAFPAEAARLLSTGADLYDRVARLDQATSDADIIAEGPARSLLHRLERSL